MCLRLGEAACTIGHSFTGSIYLALQAPVFNRRVEHDGLALGHMPVGLGHLQTQMQHLLAQRRLRDLRHEVGEFALVERADVGPIELRAAQQVLAKVFHHRVQLILRQVELLVYLEIVKALQLGLADVAIGHQCERDDAGGGLRAVGLKGLYESSPEKSPQRDGLHSAQQTSRRTGPVAQTKRMRFVL